MVICKCKLEIQYALLNTKKTKGVILTPFKMKSISQSKPTSVEPFPFVTFNPLRSLTCSAVIFCFENKKWPNLSKLPQTTKSVILTPIVQFSQIAKFFCYVAIYNVTSITVLLFLPKINSDKFGYLAAFVFPASSRLVNCSKKNCHLRIFCLFYT